MATVRGGNKGVLIVVDVQVGVVGEAWEATAGRRQRGAGR